MPFVKPNFSILAPIFGIGLLRLPAPKVQAPAPTPTKAKVLRTYYAQGGKVSSHKPDGEFQSVRASNVAEAKALLA